MQTDYEAALQAARERVSALIKRLVWGDDCGSDFSPEGEEPHDQAGCLCDEPCHIWQTEYDASLDHALRLARAIGAAEACADTHRESTTTCGWRDAVEDIIKEMEGVERVPGCTDQTHIHPADPIHLKG